MSGMAIFNATYADAASERVFAFHTNVKAQVEGGQSAPDAALKMDYPLQDTNVGELRAPFIAE